MKKGRRNSGLLKRAEHGEEQLPDNEGEQKIDPDGDCLAHGPGLHCVHFGRYKPPQGTPRPSKSRDVDTNYEDHKHSGPYWDSSCPWKGKAQHKPNRNLQIGVGEVENVMSSARGLESLVFKSILERQRKGEKLNGARMLGDWQHSDS